MQSRKAGRSRKPVALTGGRFGTVKLPVTSYIIRKSVVCDDGDTSIKAVRDIKWCKSNAPDQQLVLIWYTLFKISLLLDLTSSNKTVAITSTCRCVKSVNIGA